MNLSNKKNMNSTIITGRIGKDAEVRQAGERNAVNFSVAVTEKWLNKQGEKQESTTWFNCTLWAAPERAANIAKYIRKGDTITLRGKVTARAYVGASGEAQASLELRVDEFTFGGSANPNQQAAPQHQPAQPMQQPQPHYAQPAQSVQPAQQTMPIQSMPSASWPAIQQQPSFTDGDLPF